MSRLWPDLRSNHATAARKRVLAILAAGVKRYVGIRMLDQRPVAGLLYHLLVRNNAVVQLTGFDFLLGAIGLSSKLVYCGRVWQLS
jgi:hypothetical protein